MKKIKTFTAVIVLITIFIFSTFSCFADDKKNGKKNGKKIVVGSKDFTEQQILGKIMTALLEKNGFEPVDKIRLGGTLSVRKALMNGQIDIYMEYTGTALMAFFKHEVITDPQLCYDTVKKIDFEKNALVWMSPLNFNNTYCLMMQREKSEKKGIKTLSDLSEYVKKHKSEVKFGTNEEFYARADGYRPLQKTYGFKFIRKNIVKTTPALLYKVLKKNHVDVALGFATDARIKEFDLVALEDDKHFFPVYNPAPVVRNETLLKFPELENIFKKLAEKVNAEEMIKMNHEVDGKGKPVDEVADAWLIKAGLL
ncbi:glycine betaine ABC transporter substrate-binding protein [Desulfobacterales bacterium HSG16]|nr:glycine betaine ABC transporter substrate-binding protein [Desulfobacterales bacterium HSG16]